MHVELPSKLTLAESQGDNPTSSTKVKQLSTDNKKTKTKTKPTKHNQKNPHHQTLENCVYEFSSQHITGKRERILKNERQFWGRILTPLKKNPFSLNSEKLKKKGKKSWGL